MDSIKSSGEMMRARTFGRSFESIIGDLYYATSSTSAATGAVTASAAATATTATSTAQTGSSLKQSTSPTATPSSSRRRTIYQLPVFGESQAFWRAIDRLSPSYQTPTPTPTSATTATTTATTATTSTSTPAFSSQRFLSGLQELIDPDATRYAPVKYPSQIYTRPVKYTLIHTHSPSQISTRSAVTLA